jgi:predicted O-methyltransferase YrrM
LGLKSIVCGKGNDILSPPEAKTVLRAAEIKEFVTLTEFGGWALDAPTLDLVWSKLLEERPSTIIECGAGTSTMLFAKYATTKHRESIHIISLEQSVETKGRVERRLSEAGLGESVCIVAAPLSARSEYQFEAREMANMVAPPGGDWVFVDGPAGPEGCRTHTLLALAGYCRPGARWFLDDAFRDGELETLRFWSQSPGLSVEGIYPIGKGLATGTIEEPAQVAKTWGFGRPRFQASR